MDSLVSAFQDRVYKTALGLSGNHQDAEDITQNVFIKVFRHIKKFKGESSLATWIFRITQNESKLYLTKRSLVSFFGDWLLEKEEDYIPEAAMAQAYDEPPHELEAVMAVLQRLPYSARFILMLYHVHELSYDEISTVMQLPLGTVKSRLNRAMTRFKAQAAILRNQKEEVCHA